MGVGDALDFGDDLFGAVLGLLFVLVVLPFALAFALAFVLFSLELALVLVLVPFVMVGQLMGWLPWVLVLRAPAGQRHYVEVKGTRDMLTARRYYRSLRA